MHVRRFTPTNTYDMLTNILKLKSREIIWYQANYLSKILHKPALFTIKKMNYKKNFYFVHYAIQFRQ